MKIEQCNCEQAMHWRSLAQEIARAVENQNWQLMENIAQQIRDTEELPVDET